MVISALRQALCRDRSGMVDDLDPGRRLAAPALPASWAVHSFHFFVDWGVDPPLVGDTVLATRLVDFADGESPFSVTDEEVLQAFVDAGLHVRLGALSRVCAHYGRKLVPVLLPECDLPLLNDGTPFWVVSSGEHGQPHVTASTLSALKKAIRGTPGDSGMSALAAWTIERSGK